MPEAPARVLVTTRVLITGGAGYIGSALVTDLLARDSIERVVSLDVAHPMTCRRTPGQRAPGKLVTIKQDVREPIAAVIDEHSIDTVVHLAFLLQTHRDAPYARSINVGATERLLEACARTGVKRFIYLSSTTVYGARASNIRPFDESDETVPTPGFQYSQHKVEVERIISKFATDHPDVKITILRACPVMSPGASNFISGSLGMKFLPVPMGHDPDLQFIHLDDLLTAIVNVLHTGHATGIFNIAGEGTIKWSDLARISGATRIPVPLAVLKLIINVSWGLRLQSRSPGPGLAMITHPWLASTDKALGTLGWKPELTTRQAIENWAANK